MVLQPRPPFSLRQTLRFILSPPELLNGRRFAPLLDYFEDGEYRRAAEIGGEPVLYGVREKRRGSAVALSIRILAGRDDATQCAGKWHVNSRPTSILRRSTVSPCRTPFWCDWRNTSAACASPRRPPFMRP